MGPMGQQQGQGARAMGALLPSPGFRQLTGVFVLSATLGSCLGNSVHGDGNLGNVVTNAAFSLLCQCHKENRRQDRVDERDCAAPAAGRSSPRPASPALALTHPRDGQKASASQVIQRNTVPKKHRLNAPMPTPSPGPHRDSS